MTKTSSTLLSLIACVSLQAQLTWEGGTGDWGTASSWSPSGIPTSRDNVLIDRSGSIVTVNSPSRALLIQLGGSGTDVVTLNVNSKLTYLDKYDRRDWGADGDTIAVNINSGGTIDGSGDAAGQASRIAGNNTVTINQGGTLTDIYRLRATTNIVLNGGTFRLSGSESNGNGSFNLGPGTSISGRKGTLVFPVSGATTGTYTNIGVSVGGTIDASQLTIALDIDESYTPKAGDTFVLTTNTNGTQDLGDGTNVATQSTDGKWEFVWDTSSWKPAAGNNGVLTIDSVTWIPEPSTYAAFAGLAVLAILVVRPRR